MVEPQPSAKPTFLRQLLAPLGVVLLFAGLALTSEDTMGLGHEVFEETRLILIYTVEIGLWLSAAFLLNRLIALVIWDGIAERALGGQVPRLIKDITGVLIFAIAITAIVALVFDQSVTGFWATSSVVGLVLGFALRPMILDVFTGLAMNLDRSFVIGDWIRIHHTGREGAIDGRVLEVNWRTTRLLRDDGNEVTLPNSLVGTMIVTNFHRPKAASRFAAELCLDFAVPAERARRIMLAGATAAMDEPGMLSDPAPDAIIKSTTELGIVYEVRFWAEPWTGIAPAVARDRVVNRIVEHLQQAGISLAYPKRDTFHARMPARHLDAGSQGDREKLLSRVVLFAGLKGDELARLAARMSRRFFRGGEPVIVMGDPGDSMFILLEGITAVMVPDGSGGMMRVARLGPGTFFGEMSLLTGEPRSATIQATTDLVAYEIGKDAVGELLGERPDIAETIGAAVAARKLRNSAVAKEGTAQELAKESETLTNAIVGKMRSFFRGVMGSS